jgi:ribosomal-protein-alanine N-acetyltransferase
MIYRINKNLTVREFEAKDLKIIYFTWFQDQVVTKYSSHGKFTKGKKYYQNYLENFLMNKDRVLWAICFDNRHIGNITLGNISVINRTAEFSIIIGDKNFWKKNISYLVSLKLFEHAFLKLNINRIYCGMSSNNIGMINLAKKLKMKKEGIKRKALFLNNKYVDIVEFGILKKEFLR